MASMTVAMRDAWTDERLDDLAKRMDAGFHEVAVEQRALRNEMHALRGETKGDMKELRSELKAEIAELRSDLQAGLDRLNGRFDALIYTLIAALIALVATNFLG
jgi:hypothetical protein